MKQCPNCRCQVGTGIAVCPYCGTTMPSDEYYQQAAVNNTTAQRSSRTQPVRVPVNQARTQTVYPGAAATQVPQNTYRGNTTRFVTPTYPVSTVKTANTAYASGNMQQQDYGTYMAYPVQQPVYYEQVPVTPVAYPYYQQNWQVPTQPEEPQTDHMNLILAVLLGFMALTVIELIVLLVIMLT